MMFIPRLKKTLERLDEEKPHSYYVFLFIMGAWLLWSVLSGTLFWIGPEGEGSKGVAAAALSFLVLIPKLIMLSHYVRTSEAAFDFLNVSSSAEAIVYVISGNWSWLIPLAVLWYVLSDFIRYRQWKGKYLFT